MDAIGSEKTAIPILLVFHLLSLGMVEPPLLSKPDTVTGFGCKQLLNTEALRNTGQITLKIEITALLMWLWK